MISPEDGRSRHLVAAPAGGSLERFLWFRHLFVVLGRCQFLLSKHPRLHEGSGVNLLGEPSSR